MRRTHKGATLVEVLVSITVFAIISVVMVTCLLLMTRTVTRQEEYVRFEMILSDMKFKIDDYIKSGDNSIYSIYFTEEFQQTSDPKAFYTLTYKTVDDYLIVDVVQNQSNRVVIKNVKISNSEVTQ